MILLASVLINITISNLLDLNTFFCLYFEFEFSRLKIIVLTPFVPTPYVGSFGAESNQTKFKITNTKQINKFDSIREKPRPTILKIHHPISHKRTY